MVKIACICPPKAGETRHPGGDDITLREHLDFRGAVACRNAIFVLKSEDPESSIGDVAAVLTEQYLLNGVIGWTLVDDKGKAIEVTRARIRDLLMAHTDEAMTVGEAADDLYSEAVMRPLLAAADKDSMSLPPTPTDESTSVTNGSPTGNRKPSKRSLTTSSLTVDIEPTSALLVGGSNYSRS